MSVVSFWLFVGITAVVGLGTETGGPQADPRHAE